MNEYTASNGVAVSAVAPVTDRGPWIMVDGRNLSPNDANALREFFRAEEDERLGRWRFPENPDYVVYAWTADPTRDDKRGVTVLSEAIPRGYTVWEDNVDTLYGTSENEEARVLARKAARAYFDAHPEPKPWHDAKEGEVWAITIGPNENAYVLMDDWFQRAGNETKGINRDSTGITAGRRIWPES